MENYLRTYCEIDLDAILQNILNIKEKAGKDRGTKRPYSQRG